MKIAPRAARTVSKLLMGQEVNGELAQLPKALVGVGQYLANAPQSRRLGIFETIRETHPDGADLAEAVMSLDDSEADHEEEARSCATLADVRRLINTTEWPWPGWIAPAAITAIAADPGTGKTILGADLARRLWLGLPWPDGQANPFPARSRTLWVAGDHHFHQLVGLAEAYGIPDEAILLNAVPTDPTGGLDLDDVATLADLGSRIREEQPALVMIDTVGATTSRNLCRAEDARGYFAPLAELARSTSTPILAKTHLSKDGEALGRRIVGWCRVVMMLTCPDPEGDPDRRRLEVTKTYARKPSPLGMTISEAGCEFDSTPPEKPAPEQTRIGRPPVKVQAAMEWLKDRLARGPARVRDLRTEAAAAKIIPSEDSAKTLYPAKRALSLEDLEVDGRQWWKLPTKGVDQP